jgi:putative ABC transport system permease protein
VLEVYLMSAISVIRSIQRPFRSLGSLSVLWLATLTLGIAASTVCFTLLQQTVLKPLDFPNPEQLISVARGQGFCTSCPVTAPLLRDLQAIEGVQVSGATSVPNRLSAPNMSAINVSEGVTTPNFFETFQAPPQLGRNLTNSDADTDAIMISDSLWREQFNAQAHVIGRSVRLGETTKVIVGVASPAFVRVHRVQLFRMSKFADEGDGSNFLNVFVRKPANVTDAALQSGLDQALKVAKTRSPDNYNGDDYRLVPSDLLQARTKWISRLLTPVLWIVAVLAFLMAANTSSLFAVSTLERIPQITTELSLGAKPQRILRAFAGQAISLSLMASVFAALLLNPLFNACRNYFLGDSTSLVEVQLQWSNLLLVAFVFALLNVIAAVIPAWLIVNRVALNKSERTQVSGSGARFGKLGLCVQLISATAILLLALLLGRTAEKIASVDAGFDLSPIWTAKLILPFRPQSDTDPNNENAPHPDVIRNGQFLTSVREALLKLPQVEAVALAGDIPLGEQMWNNGTVSIPGAIGDAPNTQPYAQFRPVTEGYLDTLGLRMVSGRMPSWQAGQEFTEIALNQAYVDRFMKGVDPVGRVNEERKWRVVGVVQNVRQVGLNQEVEPDVYAPFTAFFWYAQAQLIIKLKPGANANGLFEQARLAIAQLDASVPLFEPQTGEQLRESSMQQNTLLSRVVMLFASLGLLTTMLGLFGLSAFSVAKQKREYGLRLAIGAAPMSLLRSVLGRSLIVSALCSLIGLCMGYGLSQLIASQLFGIERLDGVSMLGSLLCMVTVGGLATLVPALRASQTDPMVAMRS